MKTHTRVAVIGGGVVGCSVAYHLTKAGWKDVTLIERARQSAGGLRSMAVSTSPVCGPKPRQALASTEECMAGSA